MPHDMPRAGEVHRAYPSIDLHADSLMWTRYVGYDLLSRHSPPLPRAALGGHVDIPRMREGGMAAQCFGLVSLPIAKHGSAAVIDEQISNLLATIERSGGTLALVRNAAELLEAERAGATSALLGIEGAHALEGDIERVAHFAGRGVRYLGLMHFSKNEVGFPAYGHGRNDAMGITRFGRDVVSRCEASGVLVDAAHLNRRGVLDVCKMARKPVIVSHTGVLGAFAHWRNIDDEQLRCVADTGGVVGVIFCPRFLGGEGLGPVVAHMKHILNICGEDTPALGSDWDGFIVPTRELAEPTGLIHLTDALLAAGLSEGIVGKILRGNALRALAT